MDFNTIISFSIFPVFLNIFQNFVGPFNYYDHGFFNVQSKYKLVFFFL